jgi:1-acyl-sn-glycerol-3-phosphate acyltransferase
MILQYYCLICLRIFRVTVEQADKINVSDRRNKGIILVPNHVSSLDIFLMAALYKTVYVSKIEVKRYPVIGQLASLMGIIFLRRDSTEDRHRVLQDIIKNSKGRIITIFAQGTTGSIADHLPFKCGVFKTVEIDHDIILLPVTIHYEEDAAIAWTSRQILINNLISICTQKIIHVKVTVHKQISIDEYADKTISEICMIAQNRVLANLQTKY